MWRTRYGVGVAVAVDAATRPASGSMHAAILADLRTTEFSGGADAQHGSRGAFPAAPVQPTQVPFFSISSGVRADTNPPRLICQFDCPPLRARRTGSRFATRTTEDS
jgi:hypothetical protein